MATFKPTTRLIYSFGMAEHLFEGQASKPLQKEIDKTGTRVMEGQLRRDLRENFYNIVLLRTGERSKGMPLPIAAGVMHAYGWSMDQIQRRIRESDTDRRAWEWILLQMAFQASCAWLTPDWLLHSNYAELIDYRRWLVKLGDSTFAQRLRQNPCLFEEGVRSRMQPWVTKVLQPNFNHNVEEIAGKLRERGRAVIEATSAWLYIEFYTDLISAFEGTINSGLTKTHPLRGDRKRPDVITGWLAAPTTSDVSGLVRLPKIITPSPKQVRASQRAGVTKPPRPQDAKVQATAVPSANQAPVKPPTGDITQPVQSAEQVKPDGLTAADWVEGLANADFDWRTFTKGTLKGGFRADQPENRGEAERMAAMIVHLRKGYGRALGTQVLGDREWGALVLRLPGAMEYVNWDADAPAPEAKAPPPPTPTRRQTSQRPVASPTPTPSPYEAPPRVRPQRQQTTRTDTPQRRRTSPRPAAPSMAVPAGYPKLPTPTNVMQRGF
ncbi:MAG: hypothetical protein ACYTGE_11245 [Planctomycetota bacterium]